MTAPFRILPRITPANAHFWQGGAEGELRFLRCRACRTWIHPPSPRCPQCLAKDLAVEAVSGRGTVVSCTVNHKAWVPGEDEPYAIALVELPEQAGLRLMTNVVGCAPDRVRIGMAVRVRFEPHGEIHVPLFEPCD